MTNMSRGLLKLGDDEGPVLVHFQPKSKHRNFVMIEIHGLLDLVITNKLSGTEYRTLLLMIANMDYDNICRFTLREMAATLQQDPNVISRSVAGLKEGKVIKARAKVGSAVFYMVSPYVATKVRHNKVKELQSHWEVA